MGVLAKSSVTDLNTRRFDSTFLDFQISRAPPCLFLQSLMGNYDVSALSCTSNVEATVSNSQEFIYMYMLLMHICLKLLQLYCEIVLCDNAVTSKIP